MNRLLAREFRNEPRQMTARMQVLDDPARNRLRVCQKYDKGEDFLLCSVIARAIGPDSGDVYTLKSPLGTWYVKMRSNNSPFSLPKTSSCWIMLHSRL